MSVNDIETDQPISPRLPRQLRWVALAVIGLLAVAGFVRGLGGARPIDAILAPVKGLPAVAALNATDAAALPHNDDWSVLSGPKVLPPAPPKPAKAKTDEDAASDDSADQSSAAAEVDAQAPDDKPAPGDAPDTPAAPPGSAPPP